MSKYGEVAIEASRLVVDGLSPRVAWQNAVISVFPNSKSQQEKGCPRGAFLGLCEEGRIVGIPTGSYTRSRDNKKYALRAIEFLTQDPSLANDITALWKRIMNGHRKVHNSQMDVVVALWRRGLIS